MAVLRVSLEEEGPECSLESRVLEDLEGELKMARQSRKPLLQASPTPSPSPIVQAQPN